jgi:hypothetical protein
VTVLIGRRGRRLSGMGGTDVRLSGTDVWAVAGGGVQARSVGSGVRA